MKVSSIGSIARASFLSTGTVGPQRESGHSENIAASNLKPVARLMAIAHHSARERALRELLEEYLATTSHRFSQPREQAARSVKVDHRAARHKSPPASLGTAPASPSKNAAKSVVPAPLGGAHASGLLHTSGINSLYAFSSRFGSHFPEGYLITGRNRHFIYPRPTSQAVRHTRQFSGARTGRGPRDNAFLLQAKKLPNVNRYEPSATDVISELYLTPVGGPTAASENSLFKLPPFGIAKSV